MFDVSGEEFSNTVYMRIDSLDAFTIEEIKYYISLLNRNKSSGTDNIATYFFYRRKRFYSSLFSYHFQQNTGIYPEALTKGIIVPIFKKGEKDNPGNYRGITLISTLATLFSLCLRNRLNKYSESEDVFNDFQFGFREKKSTVDCIFILHCILQKILSYNKQLFCAFIDYEKCFDTINRD